MAIFDQRGQRVAYQYNAAGDINVGAVRNRMDLVGELEKLQCELTLAVEAGLCPPKTDISAFTSVTRPR